MMQIKYYISWEHNNGHLFGGLLEELDLLHESVRRVLRIQEVERLVVHVRAPVERPIAQPVALVLQLVALLQRSQRTWYFSYGVLYSIHI